MGIQKPNIWMYWENIPGKNKPKYIDLCMDSLKKHCKKDFKIHMLNEKNLYTYFPKMRKDLDNMSIPQKTDYIRLYALSKKGGIWVDSDIIIFKSLRNYYNDLTRYEFVGFGCHDWNCNFKTNGRGKPANWLMISRKNGVLMNRCLESADKFLDSLNSKTELAYPKNYHKLGRELLWDEIQKLDLENEKGVENTKIVESGNGNKKWDYKHYDSRCIERDIYGHKLTNERMLSQEKMDTLCDLSFIPAYNTAPGFPDWFKNMSKDEIMKGSLLISQLFRKSLLHGN
tara:strand:- start:5849 stop:6703 length:855 start_codon:yes stop_codon:yes gene_type:complete